MQPEETKKVKRKPQAIHDLDPPTSDSNATRKCLCCFNSYYIISKRGMCYDCFLKRNKDNVWPCIMCRDPLEGENTSTLCTRCNARALFDIASSPRSPFTTRLYVRDDGDVVKDFSHPFLTAWKKMASAKMKRGRLPIVGDDGVCGETPWIHVRPIRRRGRRKRQ